MKLQITVLDQTRRVNGVKTRVVEEREWKKGKLYEVARNFFAIREQTKDVFYFGEEVDFYDEKGKITKHDGSWPGLRRVPVLSLDYQADEVHQLIRSTIRAIALAGGAPGLRIAMVARCPITQEIYGDTAALGQALGLEVRQFETESNAIAWLEEA